MTSLIRKLPKISGLRKLSDTFNPPPVEAPPMPIAPDDEELKRKQRLLASQRAAKSGRASTILSEPPSDPFGS